MKTLYRQFVFTTVLIMVFSAALGFLITNSYYHHVTKEKNDEKNVAIAQELVNYIESDNDLDLNEYFTTISRIGYRFYILDEAGSAKLYGGDFNKYNLSEEAVSTVLEGNIYHGMLEFPNQSFMTGFFSNELRNTVGVPFMHNGKQYGLFLRPNISLLFSEVHTILAGLIISMALISIIAMLLWAKYLIKPITQLKDATKQISVENYNLLLNIKRQDEIGQLAESFNLMAKSLHENDLARKEFISNVSHDFQSPLLNIQGYADLLKQPDLTNDERIAYTAVIEKETKRLSSLTRQLLLLTSLDHSSYRMKKTSIPLDKHIKSITTKYMWLIQEMNLEIFYHLQPIEYLGDQSLLENVWENLISNAIKYNKTNGSIDISLVQSADNIIITIKDTGIGIKEEELPHVFERFYRADSSRTKDGTGLGLSIANDIIALHGGTIQIESEWEQGTVITISLPNHS